jgi:hypothetical protein
VRRRLGPGKPPGRMPTGSLAPPRSRLASGRPPTPEWPLRRAPDAAGRRSRWRRRHDPHPGQERFRTGHDRACHPESLCVGSAACRPGLLAERCQSGRLGRSRKPLYVQAYRGFESHPLRHSVRDRLPNENRRFEGRGSAGRVPAVGLRRLSPPLRQVGYGCRQRRVRSPCRCESRPKARAKHERQDPRPCRFCRLGCSGVRWSVIRAKGIG